MLPRSALALLLVLLPAAFPFADAESCAGRAAGPARVGWLDGGGALAYDHEGTVILRELATGRERPIADAAPLGLFFAQPGGSRIVVGVARPGEGGACYALPFATRLVDTATGRAGLLVEGPFAPAAVDWAGSGVFLFNSTAAFRASFEASLTAWRELPLAPGAGWSPASPAAVSSRGELAVARGRALYVLDAGSLDRRWGPEPVIAEEPRAMAWSPDGRLLALSAHDAGSVNDTMYLFERTASDLEPVGRFQASGPVPVLAWSPAGDRVAAAFTVTDRNGTDAVVETYNVGNLRTDHAWRFAGASPSGGLAWSPSGDRLAVGLLHGDGPRIEVVRPGSRNGASERIVPGLAAPGGEAKESPGPGFALALLAATGAVATARRRAKSWDGS